MNTYPVGAVARTESQWSHREFVEATKPEYVMMKITRARHLMKRGETFESYFGPEPTVITTTTIRDNKLNLIRWEDELEIVRKTNPDFHIPTDYSVYEHFSEKEQIKSIVSCMEGTKWMKDRLEDDGIKIIPLFKGKTREQRQIVYDTMNELNIDYGAFYASRYFTGGYGNRKWDMIHDIEEIVAEYDPQIMVIGCMAPQYVNEMPPNVVAVAGQAQWRRAVKPRKQSESEMKSEWNELSNNVFRELRHNPYTEMRIDEESWRENVFEHQAKVEDEVKRVEEKVLEKAKDNAKERLRVKEKE